jgi:hypothetical protein
MNDEAATHFASIIDNMELGLTWLRDNLGTKKNLCFLIVRKILQG